MSVELTSSEDYRREAAFSRNFAKGSCRQYWYNVIVSGAVGGIAAIAFVEGTNAIDYTNGSIGAAVSIAMAASAIRDLRATYEYEQEAARYERLAAEI